MKTNTAQNMFAACACAFALSSLPAFTQNNRTWDSGRASGDWDYSSPNWSGSVFSPGDSAILGPLASGPATLNVVGEIEANSVIVVSGYYKLAGGTLDVRNGLTVSSGTLDILNLSKLNIDGSIALNGGKMRLSGGSGNIGFGLGQLTFGGGQLVFGNSGLSDIVFDGENTDIHRISATDINMALEQGVQLIVKNSYVNSTTATPWGRGGVFYADATAGLGMGEAYSDSKVVIKGAVGSKMLFQSNSSFQNGGVIYSNTANGFKSLVNLSVGNTGSISFLDNYTRYEGNGGSIYSNGSASEVNLSGGSNAEITFSGNISRYSGGAIYSQSSGEWETSLVKLSVGDNGLIKFDGNKNNSDYMYAGAIYSDSAYISQIDIGAGAGGRILFNKNLAGSGGGGAIYSNAMTGTAPGIRSIVNLSTGDGGKIKFTDNNSKGDGGAIFAYGINGASINIAGGKNSEVAFTGNRAADNKYKRGGAVANTASTDPVSLLITAGEGSAVDISNNEASRAGGGIYSFSISNSSVRVNSGDDTRVYFIGNISGEDGGAIYSESTEQNYNDRISEVVVSAGDKSDILFVDNKANANHGGGISSVSAKQSGVSVQTGDGGSVSFTHNEAKKYGGAVYSSGGTTSLVHMEAGKNGLISVSDNSGASGGGAVYLSAQNEGRVEINGGANSVVKFERNKAASGFGGAISAYSNSSGDTVLFKVGAEGRGQLLINGNEAGSDGGAVYVSSRIAIARFDGSGAHMFQFDSNKSGGSGGFLSINGQNQAFLYMTSGDSADKSITFSSNYATKDGGAISFAATNDTSNLVMQGSGKYFFTGNMAGGDGGAISATSKNGVVNLGFGGSGSFAAPAEFRNNISGGLGGAIYVKSKGADVNFTGGVLFRGNKSGAIIAGQGASHSGGTANAMYVDYADSSDTAYFVLDSGSYFYDPITSSNLGRAQININQNAGANGTVLFSGVDYAAGSDDVKSTILASTTVHKGVFEISDNAEYGVAGSTIDIKSAATMLSGNTMGAAQNKVIASVTMQDNASINASAGGNMDIVGNLALSGTSNFNIDSARIVVGASGGSNIITSGSAVGDLISKKGSGTLAFNAANTDYKGKVNVEEGKFEVNSVFGDSSSARTEVYSNASVGGIGHLYGITTVLGGGRVVSNGTGGTLAFDTLALNNDSIVEVGIGDTYEMDLLDLSAVAGGEVYIDFKGFTEVAAGLRIFVATVVQPSMMSSEIGSYFGFDRTVYDVIFRMETQGGKTVIFADIVSVVPEPAAVAALFGAFAMAYAMIRRRK